MKNHTPTAKSNSAQGGFTLIELMIAVVILAILAAVSYGSYTKQLTKTRRAQAATAMLEIATKQEQFMAEHGTYTADLKKLNYAVSNNLPTRDGYYSISVALPDTQNFTLTATRNATQQANDPQCGDLTLNNLSVKSATNNTDSDPAKNCW